MLPTYFTSHRKRSVDLLFLALDKIPGQTGKILFSILLEISEQLEKNLIR